MFISFEGGEGTGKTTQIRLTAAFLQSRGYPVVLTREPGSTAVGRRIRAILLDPQTRDLDPKAELLLYMADRAQHIAQVIGPALADGKLVLCDRYMDATVVYQGIARDLAPEWVEALHRQVLDGLKPELTILLDLDPAIGLARASQAVADGDRSAAETRFERKALRFHQQVRQGYLDRAAAEPQRFWRVDGALPPETVQTLIQRKLDEIL